MHLDVCSRKDRMRRPAAAALALFLMLFLTVSAVFLVAESGHDCHGEDCPVCAAIEACEAAVRGAGHGVIRTAAVLPAVLIILCGVVSPSPLLPALTPVHWKIRLNN